MATENKDGNRLTTLIEDLNKIGIVIEDGEDIFQLIQGYEKKMQELRKLADDCRDSNSKKEQELLNWMTKHIEDRQMISKLQDELREERGKGENVYYTIKSNATDKMAQLEGIIKMLENEKTQIQSENKSLKKTVDELESKQADNSYDNKKSEKLEALMKENGDLLKKSATMDSELQSLKEKTKKLEYLLGSSENTKPEQIDLYSELEGEKAKLKNLQSELVKLQKENDNLRTRNDGFADEIDFLRKKLGEAGVIEEQKDAEHSFAMEQISSLKKEKIELIEERDQKVKEIHDMKTKINEFEKLTEEIKCFKTENQQLQTKFDKMKNDIQLELDVVRSQRDRSKAELLSLKNELDGMSRVIIEKDYLIRDLKERSVCSEVSNGESTYSQRTNALHVTLNKIAVNGKKQFGVYLASRPSRVLVTDAIEEQKDFVRPGDFVISINGVNVQNATNEFIWGLIKEDKMNLVLLRPGIVDQEYDIKGQDKGLKIHKTYAVCHLTTAASNAGIRIGDEIIKINDHDIESLTMHKIEKKLGSPSVKLYIRRAEEVVQSIVNASAENSGGSLHAYETINPSDYLVPENSLQQKPLNRSRLSVASSQSSTSRSTGFSSPSEGSHRQPETSGWRRKLTADSQTLQHMKSIKDLETEKDIIVTNQGPMIRDEDTDGSGDATVMREGYKPTRFEDGVYVNMKDPEQGSRQHLGALGTTHLSHISEASIAEASESSSDRETDRNSCQSNSPLLHRPQQALPDYASQASEKEYHYVGRDGKYPKQGFIREIVLRKKPADRSFGFTMFGGNAIGIFVDRIDRPSGQDEVPEGARILSMNGIDLTDAAFCFAEETLKNYASSASLRMGIVLTPANQVGKYRLQRPYDSFTIRALSDAPKMQSCTLPFKENDVLRVTDTYKDYDPETGAYLWHAMKTVSGGIYETVREGSIPAEQSNAVPISDEYPEAFEIYGGEKMKGKASILKMLKRKHSTEKIKDTIVFPRGYLYEYLDSSVKI